MKSKQLSLIFVSLLAVVLAMGMASAFNASINESGYDFGNKDSSRSIEITGNPGNLNITSISSSKFFDIKNKTNTKAHLPEQKFSISPVFSSNIRFGEHSDSINLVAKNQSGNESSVSFNADSAITFCEQGSNSTDLEISDFEITNNGKGDDDEWHPLDTIEVEVEFENNRDDEEIEDAVFELGIYEEGTSTGNEADNMMWMSEEEEQYESGEDVDDGDELSHTFEFRVDPDEFSDDNSYDITVKVYEDGNEESGCISNSSELGDEYYENIDVTYDDYEDEDEMVIIDTESYEQPIQTACGVQNRFSADVWNVGDQDFERVDVQLIGDEYDIDKTKTIGELDENDDKEVFFTFEIPRGTNPDNIFDNDLEMVTRAFEDSDDENDYELSSESFPVDLNVEGDCSIPEASVTRATLNQGSVPQAGGSFTMTTIIENTGESQQDYNVGLSNQNTWVSNYQTNRDSITLESGESTQVQLSVSVREGVSGNQSFNIQVSSDGEIVSERPVQVNVQPSQNSEENTGGFLDRDNINLNSLIPVLLALIGLALIVIAVLLIVRSSKSGKKKQQPKPGVADF